MGLFLSPLIPVPTLVWPPHVSQGLSLNIKTRFDHVPYLHNTVPCFLVTVQDPHYAYKSRHDQPPTSQPRLLTCSSCPLLHVQPHWPLTERPAPGSLLMLLSPAAMLPQICQVNSFPFFKSQLSLPHQMSSRFPVIAHHSL